ncbi:MAG: hypothetical protein HY925_09660 [Elusimicrobia bacterium]|nr:hypothetical protein [Elusimicrobiota bacterium]
MKEPFLTWLVDWLTKPGLARLKSRFQAGHASFVTARVESAKNVPEQGRMYSHYKLAAGPVHRGAAGLAELREHYEKAGGLLASLSCTFCRHEFVVSVPHGRDPLFLPNATGSASGYPASYSADWFRLWHPDCPGEPELSCPHCENSGRPEFRLL